MTLPSALKEVQASAFYGDQALDVVMLPDGVESIGSKAFAESSVSLIHLPASIKSIEAPSLITRSPPAVYFSCTRQPGRHILKS